MTRAPKSLNVHLINERLSAHESLVCTQSSMVPASVNGHQYGQALVSTIGDLHQFVMVEARSCTIQPQRHNHKIPIAAMMVEDGTSQGEGGVPGSASAMVEGGTSSSMFDSDASAEKK